MKLKTIKSKLKKKEKALKLFTDINRYHPSDKLENTISKITQEIKQFNALRVEKIQKKISELNKKLQWPYKNKTSDFIYRELQDYKISC